MNVYFRELVLEIYLFLFIPFGIAILDRLACNIKHASPKSNEEKQKQHIMAGPLLHRSRLLCILFMGFWIRTTTPYHLRGDEGVAGYEIIVAGCGEAKQGEQQWYTRCFVRDGRNYPPDQPWSHNKDENIHSPG